MKEFTFTDVWHFGLESRHQAMVDPRLVSDSIFRSHVALRASCEFRLDYHWLILSLQRILTFERNSDRMTSYPEQAGG